MSGNGSATLPAATAMGAVHLTVADLERSLAYYRESIGLEPGERSAARVSLGAGGRELLVLHEEPGARPAPRSTGLYHFALRVPERADLARWLAHAARDRVPLAGLSDHFVSEAIYLADPDGHGIEIYHDRPRETWAGLVASRLTTEPLDVTSLLGELGDPETEPFDGLPAGTDMGHVHLQVADTEASTGFYRDVLGFDLMAELFGSAAFYGAGGYHHHVGANVWHSRGAGPPPSGSAALRLATVLLPDADERDRAAARVADAGGEPEEAGGGVLVRDPSGIALLLAAAG
ncbi:MAG TPA: VOC family protein [Gaiellaceae bacterium]|nr:VOC family protein [Gaiellaceae bacterium]